jgi:iron complex outermembrane recepter protein
LAAFYIRWTDIQVEAATASGVQFETNGGSAKSQGVELETALTPLRGLTLRFNSAYTRPVLTSDIPALGYHSGDQLALTPNWSASFLSDYVVPITANWNAVLDAAYRYVGERYTLVSSDPSAMRLPSYGALDLNSGVSNRLWNVRLFVKNVTDKRGYLSETVLSAPSSGTADLVILQPRTVGVSFDLAF